MPAAKLPIAPQRDLAAGTARSCGRQDALQVSFTTLFPSPAFLLPMALQRGVPHRQVGPSRGGMTRTRFYWRHCRVSRESVTDSAYPRLGCGDSAPAAHAFLFFIALIRDFPHR